eukprot:Colp12_sorted_trinity150504_noHs@33864
MSRREPVQFELVNPPTDGISSVQFSPKTNHLLLTSWDKSVRLYDVDNNILRTSYNHRGAVLEGCFSDGSHCFSGGLDGQVYWNDFNINQPRIIGSHDKAIRCVKYSPEVGLLMSGSWDSTVKLWDIRLPTPAVSTLKQPDTVLTMDVCDDMLVVGTAGRHVWVWDIRKLACIQQRESSLKYQTRAIRCSPNKQGYCLSSIEGRVAVEYFDPSPEAQKKKYAFKCHRSDPKKQPGPEIIYPVNAIAFHPSYGTFATGGCDGFVNIWDGQNKKRLCQFHQYPTSISSLSFSHNGALLAIATSYTFEEGPKENTPPDAVVIRRVSDQEMKPK